MASIGMYTQMCDMRHDEHCMLVALAMGVVKSAVGAACLQL